MTQFRATRRLPCFRRTTIILLGIIFLAGTACAPILSPGEPPAFIQFMPDFPVLDMGTEKTRSLQLSVTLPTTPAELSGDGIILLLNERELRRLAGYRWAGTIPEQAQRSLINGLEASGIFASVSGTGAGIRPNLRLLCDLEQFAFVYPGQPNAIPDATVRFTFRLVEYPAGVVKGTLPVTVKQPAASNNVNDMAKAAEAAMAQVVSQLSSWLVSTLR